MRVLVLGAGGFIGRHIVAHLLDAGFDVTCAVRTNGQLEPVFPAAAHVVLDLCAAIDRAAWRRRLADIDIVVNAAGLLQGSGLEAVHVAGPEALYALSHETGTVRRVILISAISARPDVDTAYARTKLAGEAALKRSGLDWTILRPSLVYGKGSYGGTSLIRGLAGVPLITPVPGDARFTFSPIHVKDLAACVVSACTTSSPANQTLEPVGPDTLSLGEIIALYRGWLGYSPARQLSVPMPLIRGLARCGDLFGGGPLSTTSVNQLVAGNAGDFSRYQAVSGQNPRPMRAALGADPAEVQDRWHARLFFLAPVLKASLILLWAASGLLGLLYGAGAARVFVDALGLAGGLAWPLTIATSLLDFAIAALLLLDKVGRLAFVVQLVVVVGYTTVLGAVLPQLWSDPFGPLLKNIPIAAAILVNAALSDNR